MTFDELINKIQELLAEIQPLLSHAMPDVQSLMIKHILKIEAYSYTLAYYKAALNHQLTVMEFENLPQKSAGISAQERILAMKSKTAKTRSVLEILEDTLDIIKRRMSLCQSIIRQKEGKYE